MPTGARVPTVVHLEMSQGTVHRPREGQVQLSLAIYYRASAAARWRGEGGWRIRNPGSAPGGLEAQWCSGGAGFPGTAWPAGPNNGDEL